MGYKHRIMNQHESIYKLIKIRSLNLLNEANSIALPLLHKKNSIELAHYRMLVPIGVQLVTMKNALDKKSSKIISLHRRKIIYTQIYEKINTQRDPHANSPNPSLNHRPISQDLSRISLFIRLSLSLSPFSTTFSSDEISPIYISASQ